MREAILGLLLAAGVAVSAAAQARGLWPEVSIEINLDKTIENVGKIYADVSDRTDARERERKEESVARLTTNFAILSGAEQALAANLRYFGRTPPANLRVVDERTRSLQMKIRQIAEMFRALRDDLMAVDPKWGVDYPDLVSQLGYFTHDGVLFFNHPAGRVTLSGPGEYNALATEIENEANRLLGVATRLNEASKRP